MILIGRGLDFDAKSERLIGKRLRKFRSKNAVQLSGCKGKRTSSQFPVMMAKGYHLFPYRTQKLRPSAPMVLGWTRPGRVGRCRNPYKRSSCRDAGAFLLLLFCGFGGEFSENGCFEVALRWMGGEGNHPPPAFGGRSPFLCGGRGTARQRRVVDDTPPRPSSAAPHQSIHSLNSPPKPQK